MDARTTQPDVDERLSAICARLALADAEAIGRQVLSGMGEADQLRLYGEALVFMAKTLGYRIEISTTGPGAGDLGGVVSVVSVWPRKGAPAAAPAREEAEHAR